MSFTPGQPNAAMDIPEPTQGALRDELSREELLLRALQRERKARAKAETLLENNARSLFLARQKLESSSEQLLQSEKMASVGQLAAGIAHEINNPIGFVSSNLHSLADYIQTYKTLLERYETLTCSFDERHLSPEQQALLESIETLKTTEDLAFINEDIGNLTEECVDGLERVKQIVQNLRSFARQSEAEAKSANVNDCLESALKLVWNELKYKCHLMKQLGDLPTIECYPGELNQLFVNLLVNAGHAMEQSDGAGILTLSSFECPEGVCITVQDTGCGIPEEKVSNIFDPFFTTKEVGKGTGLGLSIVYGIIEKHHGMIEVKSEVGAGTTFIIKLPLTLKSAPKQTYFELVQRESHSSTQERVTS